MKKFALLLIGLFICSTFLFSQSLWKHRSGPGYLPNDTVLSIDSKGDTLMLGTVDGLVIKTPQQQTLLTTADGLVSDTINKIEIADDGRFLTYHNEPSLISYFDGTNITTVELDSSFLGTAFDLESDADNVFYVSSFNEVFKLSGDSLISVGPAFYTFKGINSLARGGDNVYSFYNDTLFEYKNGSLIGQYTKQGIEKLDNGDRVLVQTTVGIDDDFYRFDSQNGFVDIDPNDTYSIGSQYETIIYSDSSTVLIERGSALKQLSDSQKTLSSMNTGTLVSPLNMTKWLDRYIIVSKENGYLESYDERLSLEKEKTSSINNMNLRLNPNGSIGAIGDYQDGYDQFKGKAVFYSATNWMTGEISSTQSIRFAGDLHPGLDEGQNIESMRTNSGPFSNNYDVFKNHKTWKVTSAQIYSHIVNYSDPGYVMPADIKSWPAHGAVMRGQASCLAPFIDLNQNGIYEPQQGEYPQIRGDEALYAVFNDDYLRNTQAEQPMGIEGHVMMYSYESNDPKLNNTVFLNYRIVNRGTKDYINFRFGQNMDSNLGNGADDYTGCDTNNNFFYFYNGDNYDEGIYGFDSLPAAYGIAYLNHNLTSYRSYSFGSGWRGAPFNAAEYHHLLNGRYKNGQVPEDLQGQPSSFMYSGDPVTNTGWTEQNQGNSPSTKRGVGAISISQFNSGDTVEIDMALTLAENDGTVDNFEVVGDLRTQVQDIQQWYNNQQFDPWEYDCIAYNSLPDRDLTEGSSFKLYPNPAGNYVRIEFADELNSSNQIEIFNTLGAMVRSQKVNGKRTNIQLSDLPAGIYLVRVSGSEINETKRLIVN